MDLLFHQDLVVASLSSGSSGNCTYIGDEHSGVLVDCGISARQVFARLDAIGLGAVRIEAVLVTHEHNDHIAAGAILERKLSDRQGQPVPFYCTAGTALHWPERLRPSRLVAVASGVPIRIGALVAHPTTVPHDSAEAIAWSVDRGGVKAGVITDLGRGTRVVEALLASLDIAVLEFNHDLAMLMDGPYPWPLKQRVRGPQGHLSNAQAAEILVNAAPRRLKHLVLAHLSEENNRPEVAFYEAQRAIDTAGLQGVEVHVARRHLATGPFRVEVPPAAQLSAPAPRRAPTRTASPATLPPATFQPSLFPALAR